MKLIQINQEHYIVVDNSEIKEGDWFAFKRYDIWWYVFNKLPNGNFRKESLGVDVGKITHSTKPLDERNGGLDFIVQGILELSLQEVKELIGEVNVEKKYTEDDLRKAILMARVRIENVSPKYSIDEIFQSLQPKIEWEVEIVDGKLKLK